MKPERVFIGVLCLYGLFFLLAFNYTSAEMSPEDKKSERIVPQEAVFDQTADNSAINNQSENYAIHWYDADTPEKRAWIHDQFQALAADWEGAAVVRVAHRNRLPALVVRGVTDVGDDDLSREYAAHAAHVLAEMSGLLENIIVAIDEQLHRGRQR